MRARTLMIAVAVVAVGAAGWAYGARWSRLEAIYRYDAWAFGDDVRSELRRLAKLEKELADFRAAGESDLQGTELDQARPRRIPRPDRGERESRPAPEHAATSRPPTNGEIVPADHLGRPYSPGATTRLAPPRLGLPPGTSPIHPPSPYAIGLNSFLDIRLYY